MAGKRKIHKRSEKGQEFIELDINSIKATVVNQKSYSDSQLYATPAGNTLGKLPSDGALCHSGGELDISDKYSGGNFKTRSRIGRSPVRTVEGEKNLRQIQKELFPVREAPIKETDIRVLRIQSGDIAGSRR
jgi:hypothetical protein